MPDDRPDEHADEHAADASPDAQVRRLLAEARHDEPMPETVVARLDGVLADLAAEPARVRPVTELATRRRRVAQMLLGAAAVVVVGVGVQQLASPDQADEAAVVDRQASRDDVADENLSGDSAAAESFAGESQPAEEPQQQKQLRELSPNDFSRDVLAVRTRAAATTDEGTTSGLNDSLERAYTATGRACGADGWGAGTFVPVRYEGGPAILVFREVMGDSQVADLFVCGDPEPIRSVTLPAS